MSRSWFPSLPGNAPTGHKSREPQWPDAQSKALCDVVIVGAGRYGPGVGNAGRNTPDDRFRIEIWRPFADHARHLLAGISREIEPGI